MSATKSLTPLEIYKVLQKNNCKQCALPSCLAFAVAVVAGQKKFLNRAALIFSDYLFHIIISSVLVNIRC